MTTAKALILGCFMAVFSPKSRKPLGEWMSENIILRPEENPSKPGPYDPDYSPGPAKLLDLFFGSPEWNECIIRKSGQSAFSFHVLGHITRMVREAPANCLYVMDSDKQAGKISERLQAFLEDSPATAQIFRENEDGITKGTYALPGMTLWLTGAGSAGSLASVTVKLGVADEVDKHKSLKGEARTLALLRVRLKEQTDAKLIAFSTPTLVTGQINGEYETGSRHKYHVPCPHCERLQHLEWKQMRFAHCKDLLGDQWDLWRIIEETYYECGNEDCKKPIYDRDKREMMKRGIWLPTNFRTVTNDAGEDIQVPAWEPAKLSAHYSDLYSQNDNVSFGQLAKKFVAAQKDPGGLRDFNQNHLGEPDQDTIGEVTESKLLSLRGQYRRQRDIQNRLSGGIDYDEHEVHDPGTPIPARILLAALISDTQDDNSKWSIQAFAENGDQYIVDWGSCLELSDLDDIAKRTVNTKYGPVPITLTMIDEGGHRTYEVRQHAYPRFPACFSSRGSPGSVGSVFSLKDYNVIKDDPNSPKMPVVVYEDKIFLRELYIRRIARFDAEKFAALELPRLWLPVNLEQDLIDDLMKQKLERQPKGPPKWNTPKGNDWGDTCKMGIILWSWVGPDLLRDHVQANAEEAAAS